ncbi:WD-repeat protein, putative [Ricinus communis]|uniref:WD-repeat protein, putative n=1 Tax=Ricinus communis TaxID=3988 RepID=B9SAP3_RICCO|nr:WD-repeat protein, putative [Ricinus communis]|eukprot:XP_002523062.1 WD repeat-containing protein GTS1 [Ricinus communis]
MEEAMEVEVEHPNPNPNPNCAKRFGLKSCFQTNFGDDYVFQIVPKADCSTMAVSLSTYAVKLYSPLTGQYQGECKGHSDTINQIAFSASSSPHVLHSCSSDGTMRAWDTRTFRQVSCITAAASQEIFSFSFGGSTDNLLAAGSKSQILFWDWRNKKQVACLEESHTDDVTQVHFVPGHGNKLLSASVDGLMCIFDTNGDINDDDHLESVINVGTSVGKVGFFGENYQKLWCLTHIESLSIWDWEDARNEANLQEARSMASKNWALDQIDYFVDCHYPGEGESLWVIGGTNAGALGYFPVNYRGGAAAIGSPEAILEGGHSGVVRSILPLSSLKGGPAQSQGIFGWTGGEDGRLCCWLSDNSARIDRSWMSSALAMRSSTSRKKNRHHPY